MKNGAVRIGLAGFGTIGTGVVKTILDKGGMLTDRTGYRFELARVADIDIERDRGVGLGPSVLTRDVDEILDDGSIDIFVELMGGIHPAKEFIVGAMRRGKSIVTANKALLAGHGAELFRTAEQNGVHIGFEASVGGGIPIIRAITNSLVANRFISISAIINGTSNYILSKMTQQGGEFADVLAEAKSRGYAEADPSFDVDGIDAAHKLVILLVLAYRGAVSMDDIYVEGIRGITQLDINFAAELGYVIKHLAIAKSDGREVSARVHPAMVAKGTIISMINDVYNGIHVVGDAVGSQLFVGRGAGMMPTASAVVSDIVDISKKLGEKGVSPLRHNIFTDRKTVKIIPIGRIKTRYYLRFTVLDRPGVLARIARVLGTHGISIESVIQKARSAGEFVPIVIMTHSAAEASLVRALKIIDRFKVVREKTKFIRIEEEVI
ncbi:MAG: homoserine dehydrogenase [Deltaproteobacteria bacterium]|nr:homoserine dehydrogenase [Deltaproteobacteria bacterium]